MSSEVCRVASRSIKMKSSDLDMLIATGIKHSSTGFSSSSLLDEGASSSADYFFIQFEMPVSDHDLNRIL